MDMLKQDDPTARLEAALYASGRPLSLDELIRISGNGSRKQTIELLDGIIQRSQRAFRALEIALLPNGNYVFQVKPRYYQYVRRFATSPHLSGALRRTLGYIAANQPVSSKDLADVRGTGVYGHLKELRQLGYVQYQRAGRVKIYHTTEEFENYFGIDDPAQIKKSLLARMDTASGKDVASSG